MKASTEQLVSALRVLSVEIQSADGVANAVVAEAADRMTLLANLVARHVEETKDDVEQMNEASKAMIAANAKINELQNRIGMLKSIIDRASTVFFADGSDAAAATVMLEILNEAREAKP